jgi:hypothetical protein
MGNALEPKIGTEPSRLAKFLPPLIETVLWATLFYVVVYFYFPPQPSKDLVSLFVLFGFLIRYIRKALVSKWKPASAIAPASPKEQ